MTNGQTAESLRVKEAADRIRAMVARPPEVALILGSGLGVLAEAMQDPVTVSYADIPHFPVTTVEGHANELAIGEIESVPALIMKGRFHLYEGYDPATIAFPIRVFRELGVKCLLVTNAAGGVNTAYHPGELMLIEDQINFMSRNPLIGSNDERVGPRFPDMSEAYNASLRERALRIADQVGISLRRGVYMGMLGPTYETPAEVRMARALGADCVGMSTVPEVTAARHAGLEVLGISCITNMACGILDQPLDHGEVMAVAAKVREQFLALVREIIRDWGADA